jgi:4'-phosphopantetheinyl transferase
MLKVFFLPVTENYKANWKVYLETLPNNIQHDILRLKIPSTQIQKTYAKILLKQTLLCLGQPETILNKIEISKNGKPVIPSFSGDFNISHSDNLIALIISDKPGAGIDLEKTRIVNTTGFKHYFTQEEWQRIMNANEKENTLLKLWTIKEALLKARSTGFSNGIDDLSINYTGNTAQFRSDNNVYYWNHIDIFSEYIVCYASSQKDVIPDVTIVDLASLA